MTSAGTRWLDRCARPTTGHQSEMADHHDRTGDMGTRWPDLVKHNFRATAHGRQCRPQSLRRPTLPFKPTSDGWNLISHPSKIQQQSACLNLFNAQPTHYGWHLGPWAPDDCGHRRAIDAAGLKAMEVGCQASSTRRPQRSTVVRPKSFAISEMSSRTVGTSLETLNIRRPVAVGMSATQIALSDAGYGYLIETKEWTGQIDGNDGGWMLPSLDGRSVVRKDAPIFL